MGGGGGERHDDYRRWLPRRGCADDNWLPCRTCPGKRRNLLEKSRGGHSDRPRIRHRQDVPYRHSAPGQRAGLGPDDAVARGGDFARTLAFDVLLAPAVEIAQTIAFRLALTIAFAYVIPVPIVIYVAGRELVLRGGLVPRQRTPVGKLVPDGQGLRVLGTEDFLIGG